tara:strand:+ start:1662 stop:1970 length:309 start_codon:yes stop_codon:yes gene_type:complete
MTTPSFKRGDIVRWRAFVSDVEFYYGLVIECDDFAEIGYMDFPYYSYEELTKSDYTTFMTRKITLFSFYAQKIVTLHQSAADLPVFPEIVRLYEASEIEKIT